MKLFIFWIVDIPWVMFVKISQTYDKQENNTSNEGLTIIKS